MKGRGRRRRNESVARPRSGGEGGDGPLSGYEVGSDAARARFGSREGSRGGDYSQADLVTLVAASQGRAFTPEEERFVRQRVAEAGFDPGTSTVPRKWDGKEYRGVVLRNGDTLSNTEVHDYRHVIEQAEWPEGTSQQGYVASVRDVVLGSESIILYNRRGEPPNDRKHLAFTRPSGDLRGPGGDEWVWVEYRLETGYLMTAHQRPDSPEEMASRPNRKDIQWMNAKR